MVRTVSPRHHAGQPPAFAGPRCRTGRCGSRAGQGLDDRHVGRGAAGGLDHEAGLDEAEAGAADVLGQGDAEQPGRGQLRQSLRSKRSRRARTRSPQPLGGDEIGEDPVGQLADGLLLLAEEKSMVRSLPLSWVRCRSG